MSYLPSSLQGVGHHFAFSAVVIQSSARFDSVTRDVKKWIHSSATALDNACVLSPLSSLAETLKLTLHLQWLTHSAWLRHHECVHYFQ
jgi:hypothetical protein